MIGELETKTVYQVPEEDGEKSLVNGARRRDLGWGWKRFKGARGVVRGLGLQAVHSQEIGNNRILQIMHKGVYVANFGSETPTFVNFGYADECEEVDGELVPRAIVLRESKWSFNAAEFRRGVEGLRDYDQQFPRLPKFLRGDVPVGLGTLGLGPVGAGVIGAVTGDGIYAITAGGIAGAVGFAGGKHLQDLDQWEAQRRVSGLNEYYSNDNAMERLEAIQAHLETHRLLTGVQEALTRQRLKVSSAEILKGWRSAESVIQSYNAKTRVHGFDDQLRTALEAEITAGIRKSILDERKAS